VGSNQLISTGVTPASYTAASITVDADGRITAASSGSAGAGMGVLTIASNGPSSGTLTASPSASRLGVYMWAGGGGGGGGPSGSPASPGGTGGVGGFGYYDKVITQPFSQPYSIGGGGNGGSQGGGSGGTGGNTTITNVGTVNGGGGGPGTPGTGSTGNQPGATLSLPSRNFLVGATVGTGGGGGTQATNEAGPSPGGPGTPGCLVVYQNTGT
jgi:hypothetical protein